MSRQQIQIRRDTAANWTAANPVLADGEWALETDTRLLKLGDGTTAWDSLDYFSGGVVNLVDLQDVAAANRVEGSVLSYDASRAKFVADSLTTKLTLTDGGNF